MKIEEDDFIKKYDELCARIAGAADYPKLTSKFEAECTNGSFIEYKDDNVYAYGGCERGKCSSVFESSDWYECMYHPILFAFEQLGYEYAIDHKREGFDSRIIAFNHVINNLKILDTNWAEKFHADAKAILARDNIDF